MTDEVTQIEDLSALSSDRRDEIKRSQAQMGIVENLKAGFSLTALSAGARKIEDEAPALFKPTFAELTGKLPIEDGSLKSALQTKGVELDRNIASVKALVGVTSEGHDPTYEPSEHIDDLISGIPRKYHEDIMSENSLAAAERVRGRILEDLEVQSNIGLQNDGIGVRLAGSLLDVDAPLSLFSGGSYAAAKTSYVGLRAAELVGLGNKAQRRAASFTQGVSGGVQAGFVVGLADSQFRETTGLLDLTYSTLGGAALGGTFGTAFNSTVLGPEVKANLTATLDDFEARVSESDPSLHAETSAEAMFTTGESIVNSSVGASETLGNKIERFKEKVIDDPLGRTSSRSREIIDAADKSNHDEGFYDRRAEEDGTFWEKVGNSKWNVATGTSFAAKMYRSDSAVMNWLGRKVFENPNGYNRGSTTSAVLMENYHKLIQTQFEPYSVGLKAWSKRNGKTFLGTGHGSTQSGRAEFNRAVMLERNARQHGKARSTDPDIRLAADALDNAALEAHKIAKGREGQHSVDGFENVKENPHYTPYNWSGTKISDIILGSSDAAGTRKAITEGLAESYRKAGMVEGKDALAVANAVIRRAQLKEAEIDTSVFSLLQKDGQEFLRDALEDAGTSPREIDGIMQRLIGDNAERSKESFVKSRNEVDMDSTIQLPNGEELKIVDLMSNDLFGDWQRYTRRVSGASALARNGITNRAQRKEIIQAIHAEQRSKGEEITPAEELNAMFTNFDGGAIKGWAKSMGGEPTEPGRLVATSKRMVQLAWLNKLGLTQLGETGAMMAQNGLENWATRGPMKWLNKEIASGNQALLDDLAAFTGSIGKDHDYFGQHLNLDEVSVLDKADYQGKAQSYISDAVYVQGFTSMFNQARAFQQKTAALLVSDKIMRGLKTGLDTNKVDSRFEARLFSDFGLDNIAARKLETLIDNGTIKFKTTGRNTFVDELNMSQWEPELAEEFAAAVTRNINQVVQKSMAGEQDAWMHTGAGSILTHLKTFPMQATQKQMVRHFRHNDPEAYAAVGYSLATAMVVSLVREGIDMDGEHNMSLADHSKRAFAYSNMTGFIPMAYDPLMTIMGLEDKRFNQFGDHSEITPPVLSFANDAMRLPGALGAAATGELDYSDRAALRTLPYSNTYLIGDMLNQMGR